MALYAMKQTKKDLRLAAIFRRGCFITAYAREETTKVCQSIIDYSIKKYGKKNQEIRNRKCSIKKRLSSERRWGSKGIHYYVRREYEIIEEYKDKYPIIDKIQEI